MDFVSSARKFPLWHSKCFLFQKNRKVSAVKRRKYEQNGYLLQVEIIMLLPQKLKKLKFQKTGALDALFQ